MSACNMVFQFLMNASLGFHHYVCIIVETIAQNIHLQCVCLSVCVCTHAHACTHGHTYMHAHAPRKDTHTHAHTSYGEVTLKSIRRLEKIGLKNRKTESDINFLETCRDANVIPCFPRFRTASTNLMESSSYKECQNLLLQAEIDVKQKRLEDLNKNFKT